MCQPFHSFARLVLGILSIRPEPPAHPPNGNLSISSRHLRVEQLEAIWSILRARNSKEYIQREIRDYVSTQDEYMQELYANFTEARDQLMGRVRMARERRFASYSPEMLAVAFQLQAIEDTQSYKLIDCCARINVRIGQLFNGTADGKTWESAEEEVHHPRDDTFHRLGLERLVCGNESVRLFPLYFPSYDGRISGYDRFKWNRLSEDSE